MNFDFQVTDPSTEMANFLSQLNAHEKNLDEGTVSILGRYFGVGEGTAQFYMAYGAIHKRISSLEKLIQSISVDEISNRMRSVMLSSTVRVRSILHPSQMAQPWRSIAHNINDETIVKFELFGQTARRIRPLRRISESDVEQKVADLCDILEMVRSSEVVGGWIRSALSNALEDLIFEISNMPVFGHDIVMDDICMFQHQVDSLLNRIHGEEKANNIRETISVIEAIATRVALVGAIFCLPDQGLTAIERYSSWMRPAITTVAPSTPKALTGPRAIDT